LCRFRNHFYGRSQWPRRLRRGSVAARLLGSWVRIPPGGMDVCPLWVLCFIAQGSLPRADHSSRGILPSVVCRTECDLETSKKEATWARFGLLCHRKGKNISMSVTAPACVCVFWSFLTAVDVKAASHTLS
jgi:hypothetical protein